MYIIFCGNIRLVIEFKISVTGAYPESAETRLNPYIYTVSVKSSKHYRMLVVYTRNCHLI
jgi:hypothetical protein